MKHAESRRRLPRLFQPPGSWSITSRLTVFYALSTFGILVLATGFLHWVLTSNLDREDNQFLADKIHVIRAVLAKYPADPMALEEEIKWEGTTFRFTKYYARVLDRHGRILIETPGMRRVIAPSRFPAPVGPTTLPARGTVRKSTGEAYLTMAAMAQTGKTDSSLRIIQVTLNVSNEDALVTDYRHKLEGVLVVGMLFSTGFGILLARKGMRPLQEITRKIQLVSSTQLHERIDATRWPRELSSLATAFDGMLDRLEDSFNRLSQFSADLAHELRTPINNLMGEAEVALSRSRSGNELRQVLESGLEEYGRLARMIDSLLFLARADSAKTPVDRAPLDGRRELETVRDFYEAVASEEAVTVTCKGTGTICADRGLLRRAISNLLANALRHTPPGGTIMLSLGQCPDGGGELFISDTGEGIEAHHLSRIFDRFYRADSARSAETPGTGLGLAIVQSIMGLHGGTAAIESETGQGTTVTLHFPPCPRAQPAPKMSALSS